MAKYLVRMKEIYYYEQEVTAKDADELNDIIHGWDPIIDDEDFVAENREDIKFEMEYEINDIKESEVK